MSYIQLLQQLWLGMDEMQEDTLREWLLLKRDKRVLT